MKTYKNQASGVIVSSGKIKSVSEDRMVLTLVSSEFDRGTSANVEKEYEVSCGIPFGDEYKPGFTVTAVGYQRGKGVIMAESVLAGNDVYETQDLAVVSGLVKFARLNEEKNADGTPKTKQDGSPKKPHFDITVTVHDGEKYVDHVVKVYEGAVEQGKKSQMDIVKSLFKNFDRESNRIRVSIVTQPGQSYSRTVNKDGKEYVNWGCSHMGYRSLDVDFIDAKEKTNDAPQKPQQEQPVPQPQEQPQITQPQNGAGFDAPNISMEEDELFK